MEEALGSGFIKLASQLVLSQEKEKKVEGVKDPFKVEGAWKLSSAASLTKRCKIIPKRFRACNFYSCFLINSKVFLTPSAVTPFPKRVCPGPASSCCLDFLKDPKICFPFSRRYMSNYSNFSTVNEQMRAQSVELLRADEDSHGGVVVSIEEPMDSVVFASLLGVSMSQWRQQGKKGVWIKLPLEHSNLVDAAIKQGFRYHHAEPDYVMLVQWIPDTADTLPVNASHRVGIGAFVMNNKGEVLVVQETSGRFKGTGVWKMPTGTVNEGEDISTAAIREVKEETGIETEFLEVLAFRQSHESFFRKSDIFFVCMLQPLSFDIQKQTSEIEDAKWIPVEDYAAQPFVQENQLFDFVAKICLSKSEGNYSGFSPFPTTTSSGKKTYLYFNNRDVKHLLSSSI